MLRSAAEMGVGLLYTAGAVFNGVYTVRHSAEFYGTFADGAWLSPAEWFVRRLVIPNGAPFTVLLIAFQAAVAIAILSRGELVGPALLVGGGFAVVVAIFSSPGGTAGNLALAAIQFALAFTR